MKIIGTGLTGLIGSRIVELLTDKYEFENISRSAGIDILDKEAVREKIISSEASVILHLAGFTDVDGCEKEKELGGKGYCYQLNVAATENIAQAVYESSKKLIYISTDFVFDGEIGESDAYSEEDLPNPINWYGTTKYEGEKVVLSTLENAIVARIAYPFTARGAKKDFVRYVLSRLQSGQSLKMVTDHIMTPTFIDDIAAAIDVLIRNNAKGIFHVVGSDSFSPYEAAWKIASVFDVKNPDIGKITREKFFAGRAPRPFCLALKNDKIVKLGTRMRTFENGLQAVREQLENPKYKVRNSK